MKFTSGTLLSILLHGLILVLLVVDLPHSMPEPEKPEAIQVELLKPEKKAEPKPAAKPEAKPKPTPKKPVAKKQATKEPPPKELAKAKPREVLRPVYKFGDKDSGSEKPSKGDAKRAEEANKPPPPEKPEKVEKPKKQQDLPKKTVKLPTASQAESALAAKEAVAVAAAAAAIKPRPKTPVATSKARRSKSDNQGPVAVTAIGQLPRGIRAGKLCITELRRQMNSSNPPVWPDLLPSYRLDQGNILQVRKGAFRTRAQWVNLKFRCKIDDAATQIVSFGFEVGTPVPRSQWSSRGLPES